MKEATTHTSDLTTLPPQAESLMTLIARASGDTSIDIGKFERLLAMRERLEIVAARKAFNAAMAAAKGEISPIVKNREVDFISSKGRTNYRYENFAAIAAVIDPIFSKHGLAYRFRTKTPPGEPISVTCIIFHSEGHEEENTLTAPRDDSGNKNGIQGIGSTQQYLMRYTLKSAIGLAVADDDDGRASSGTKEPNLDDSVISYLGYAQEKLAEIATRADLAAWWKGQSDQRKVLNLHDNSPGFKKLFAMVSSHNQELTK